MLFWNTNTLPCLLFFFLCLLFDSCVIGKQGGNVPENTSHFLLNDEIEIESMHGMDRLRVHPIFDLGLKIRHAIRYPMKIFFSFWLNRPPLLPCPRIPK